MDLCGTVFHGLKLLTHCGGGAYGDVYYCEDISGKKMAVKIISKKKLGDSWERELRGVINYRKITEKEPKLLKIFHVEEDEESFFYTMEAADNAGDYDVYTPDTLAGRLKHGAIPSENLSDVISAIFDNIKLIHEAGFVHRDIKPDNILFVKGVPKLADLGLLSSLSNSMTMLAGTLDFIPPEERAAESWESSSRLSRQRNDLYAFGKVIYCAVTGLGPHEYPAIPREMALNLPGKFFLNLSFLLCSKDSAGRLDSIEKTQKELDTVKKKLLHGENTVDRCRDILKSIWRKIRCFSASLCTWFKRGWLVFLFFILMLLSVTVYWQNKKSQFDAEEYFRIAAENGDVEAQKNLGIYYYYGEGDVEQNYAKAVKYFLLAADNGNAEAQNMLGICYAAGRGIEQNSEKSVEWFRKSAEQGNPWGQYNLGTRYFHGSVVEKDLHKAFQLFYKSAEQGNASSQYWLGVCYRNGYGTAPDLELAKFWLIKASDGGNEDAKKMLKSM